MIWAGDQQTDFSEGDGLPSVIPMGLNLGLAGFPYFGSDIAGYMSQGTTPTTEELFYRWTTFGALTPVMRTHHGRSARENYQWEHDAGADRALSSLGAPAHAARRLPPRARAAATTAMACRWSG